MGNSQNRGVAKEMKDQDKLANSKTKIYQFVSLGGGGELIDLMKKAAMKNDYDEVCYYYWVSGPNKPIAIFKINNQKCIKLYTVLLAKPLCTL